MLNVNEIHKVIYINDYQRFLIPYNIKIYIDIINEKIVLSFYKEIKFVFWIMIIKLIIKIKMIFYFATIQLL